MIEISLQSPDDWHLHFRDGDMLDETVAATARCFKRAIAMPNLIPPITTGALAKAYQQRILAACPEGNAFQPLMTIYLTDNTSPAMIKQAKQAGVIAAKLYPAGATTNATSAVNHLENLFPVFEALAEQGLLLLVHGEVTDQAIDVFDREKAFIDRHLSTIVQRFPHLKVVFEHITTADAAQFVETASDQVAATITPQHLLLNRNDLLVGGIQPHHYCLPVLKRNTHQQALRDCLIKGNPKFFLGTDSAPHEKRFKESACGCAGCYNAGNALELYAQVFDELDALDKLEGFASHYGADFYGLARNSDTVTLIKQDWQVPEQIILPNGQAIVPFWAGRTLHWQLKNS